MLATCIDTVYRLSGRLLAFHLFSVSSLCSAPLPFSHDVFFPSMRGILTWAVFDASFRVYRQKQRLMGDCSRFRAVKQERC